MDDWLCAVPRAPIAQRGFAVLTDRLAVEDSYRTPRTFWRAWDEHIEHAGRSLLLRGLELPTSEAWFERTYASDWGLARAARPGLTQYGVLEAPPGHEGTLRAGRRRMKVVGYIRSRQLVELAVHIAPSSHIPGWEILEWYDRLEAGLLGRDQPLQIVRVVFRSEAMARREGVPLLDIGAQVWFVGRDGLDHRFTG